MKYKKIISNKNEWIGYVSRKDYNKLKVKGWFRTKWRLNPFEPKVIKVFQRRKK